MRKSNSRPGPFAHAATAMMFALILAAANLAHSGDPNTQDSNQPRSTFLTQLDLHPGLLESTVAGTNFQQVPPPVPNLTADVPAMTNMGVSQTADPRRFEGQFSNRPDTYGVGVDLYSPPEFEGGLLIYGDNVAMKIGGYTKADFIYDFNPIDNTDSFVTTTIDVGAPPRTNARFHARQSRLSFDTRWLTSGYTVRIFVESDFFSDGDRFRLRHAYGEVGSLLLGQTWTTFTDVAAAPATLDFEGSVSSVNRRQAQARYTRSLWFEDLTMSLSVEDTQFIIEVPDNVVGESRSPSPDFVARLRLARPLASTQGAFLYRIGGFQGDGEKVETGSAWGFNFTGVALLTQSDKFYTQILFGDGIGSYRSLPDASPLPDGTEKVLPLFGWMLGFTHDWSDQLSSNFTYAENSLDNKDTQDPDDVSETSYLAANLLWSPLDRVTLGIEYLYGTRVNVDGASGVANRLQTAFIFNLP